MKLSIHSSKLSGSIQIPSSKSHTLRAIVFALMAKGKSVIHHPLPSPDTESMIHAAELMGAKITRFEHHLHIEGVGGKLLPPDDVINAGNSGQVLRFIGALSGLSSHYTIITGDHSIRHSRPALPLLKALRELGAHAESARGDGHAPLIIKGPLRPGVATLCGKDSQPVSALLIATSFLPGISEIYVTDPGEKPWIDLTLSWLSKFGIKIKNDRYEHYTVPGNASYSGFEATIPGDFSTAAFPLTAALITGSELILENLDMDDVQGDKKAIQLLIEMGANIEINKKDKQIIVKKGGKIQGRKIDLNDCIDAIGIFAVIGCFAEGKTEIVNAAIARKKECDRISALTKELKKMGAKIEENEDGLIIYPSVLKGANLETYHDHRMVLSFVAASLAAQGNSTIDGVEAAAKTYPNFADEFRKIGADIR
ncbi:MAG TPA: 3-phosphoshikimate 1-carboxyvinyltransferase [Rhabdochlamydiaceae bacterium]|nr:3-phosphoshikimate 1-carboxyvinyltransferase [Rhabdochlamydiaceae bacterium]